MNGFEIPNGRRTVSQGKDSMVCAEPVRPVSTPSYLQEAQLHTGYLRAGRLSAWPCCHRRLVLSDPATSPALKMPSSMQWGRSREARCYTPHLTCCDHFFQLPHPHHPLTPCQAAQRTAQDARQATECTEQTEVYRALLKGQRGAWNPATGPSGQGAQHFAGIGETPVPGCLGWSRGLSSFQHLRPMLQWQ